VTFAIILVGISLIIVMAVSIFFVIHKDYSVGFIGGLGLLMISVGAYSRLSSIMEHMENVYLSPVSVFVWTGLALYLSDRMKRFVKRTKKRNHWYPSEDNYAKKRENNEA